MRSNNNKFTSVKRDRNLNSLQTTTRDKIPRFRNIDAVGGMGGEPGQEGEIILNRSDNTFYGHDGYSWVPLNNVPVSLRGVGGNRHYSTNLVVDGCGPELKIRNLCAGKGVHLDTCHGCVTITNTATSGDDVTLKGRGEGYDLVLDGQGPDLSIRNLVARKGLSVKFEGDSLVLTNENPTPQPPTTLENACNDGTSLVANGTGPNLSIKGLVKGDGIDFSENDGCVTISNTNPTPSPTTTLSDVGGCDHSVGLTAGDGVGPNLKIGRLNPGCGIDLCKEDDGSVTIVNCDPGSDVTLCGADCCSDEDSINLVLESSGPDLAIRNLKTDGEGISLDTEDGCVTFTNTAPHVPTQLIGAGCSPENSASLVIDGDSNPLVIRNLRGVGKGIKVEEVGGCVEISNTNTLKGKGGCHHAVDLVLKGDKPEFEIRNLNAGRGIELDTYDGCVTITNTKDCDQVTLCGKGCCPCESVNLVLDGCGPNLAIRNLTAGDGIDLDTDCDGCLVISCVCPPTTLTGLACSPEESPAGSVDLVVDGTGPELVIRNLAAGKGIILDTDGGCVNISSFDAQISLGSTKCSPEGIDIVADGVGPELLVKQFTAGPGIEITDNDTCVTVSSLTSLNSAACSPVNADAVDLVLDGIGPDFVLRQFVAGEGIELNTDDICVTVINSDPGSAVTLTGVGCSPEDSVDLVVKSDGPDLQISNLTAGDGITLSKDDNCVTISAIPEPQVTLNSLACSPGDSPANEIDLVVDGVGPELVIRNLAAGKGIILDTDGGCVNISSFDAQISLGSTKCSPEGIDIVADGVGPELLVKQFTAGPGIEITDNDTCVTVSSLTSLNSAECSPVNADAVDLVLDGVGPDFVLRQFVAGEGIELNTDGVCVTVINSDPGSAVTLTGVGCSPEDSVDLVVKNDGPDLQISNLTAGDGITLSKDDNCVTISAIPEPQVTLNSLACSPGDSPANEIDLVVDGVGPGLVIRNLAAGKGIILDTDGGCVNISSFDAQISLGSTKCSPEGIDIVADGAGPELLVKQFTAGPGIEITDDDTCVTVSSLTSLNSAACSPVNADAVDLVLDGVGPDFVLRQFVAGEGIELNTDGVCVTVINTEPASTVTLSSQDCSPEGSPDDSVDLVVEGNGPELVIRKLKGNVVLNDDGCVDITDKDDGFEARDDNDNIITDNAAAGIVTSGVGSTAGGFKAQAIAINATAIGNSSKATVDNSTALGSLSQATADSTVAVGVLSQATANNSTSVGVLSKATAINATAVGVTSQATVDNSTALGSISQATAINATAVGVFSKATAINASAFGIDAQATGRNAVALGVSTRAVESAVALGGSAQANKASSLALGNSAVSDNENSIVINAFGVPLTSLEDSAFYVKPIRNADQASPSPDQMLCYDPNSGEITYADKLISDVTTLSSLDCSPDQDDSVSLIVNGQGPELVIRNLAAGKGIILDTDGGCVNISSFDAQISLGSTKCSPEGIDIVADGVGPELLVKQFTAGPGIEITDNDTCVTVSSLTSLKSAACSPVNADAVDLVLDGVGPDFVLRQFVAGEGIELNTDGVCVTVINTEPASTVTLSSQDCSPEGSPDDSVDLVVEGNGPELVIRKLKGNVVLSDDGCVDITDKDDGFEARDDNDNIITDNAAAGIVTSGVGSTAGGFKAQAIAINATAIGNSSKATVDNSTALGSLSQATADSTVAVGVLSRATANNSTAVGVTSKATAINATAVGVTSQATVDNSTALGSFSQASAKNTVAVGVTSRATVNNSIAVGSFSKASAINATAVGIDAQATGLNAVALGVSARAADDAVAIGGSARANKTSSLALGNAAVSDNESSIVINAFGVPLTSLEDSAFYVKPIRNADQASPSPDQMLCYDPDSGEITYTDKLISDVTTLSSLDCSPDQDDSVSLIVNGQGPELVIRKLVAGNGITLDTDTGCVTVAAVNPFAGKVVNVCGTTAVIEPEISNISPLDINVVISTPGSGFLARDIPDNAIPGGNCRGDYAVDWQSLRTVADQVASGVLSTIGGGQGNKVSGDESTIGGGSFNTVDGVRSTIGGGFNNRAITSNGIYIGGGFNNTATGFASSIGGGRGNEALEDNSTISGGVGNMANKTDSTVGGGTNNKADGAASTVGGGSNNKANSDFSTVGGGFINIADGAAATVSGGQDNNAAGEWSAIPGGQGLQTPANHSCAVGKFNDAGLFSSPPDTERIFMVGYGVNNLSRSNLFSVTADGNARAQTAFISGGADYAEYFESIDRNSIPVGTSVIHIPGTSNIRPAKAGEVPTGVISNNAGIIGNSAFDHWYKKYLKDSEGNYVMTTMEIEEQVPETVEKEIETIELREELLDGKKIYRQEKVTKFVTEKVTEEIKVFDENDNEIGKHTVPKMQTVKKLIATKALNPDYDPNMDYIQRSMRPEWNLVALLGIVKILPGQPTNNNWIKLADQDWLIK